MREDRTVSLTSLDYDLTRTFPIDEPLPIDGELDLLKGVVNHFRALAVAKGGFDLLVHSDAPPGQRARRLLDPRHRPGRPDVRVAPQGLTNYEIAELTHKIERVDLKIAGGRQDQYAAVFGGFNFIEFQYDHTIVNPLRIRREVVNELEYSTLLCYTGSTRMSAHIVENQMRSYIQGKEAVIQSLDRMKELTIEMKAALLRDRVRRVRRASARSLGREEGPRSRDHDRADRPPLSGRARERRDRRQDPRRGRRRVPPGLLSLREEARDRAGPRGGRGQARALRPRGAGVADMDGASGRRGEPLALRFAYVGTAYPMRGGIAQFNALLARELAKRPPGRLLLLHAPVPVAPLPGQDADGERRRPRARRRAGDGRLDRALDLAAHRACDRAREDPTSSCSSTGCPSSPPASGRSRGARARSRGGPHDPHLRQS